jgi:ATP-binding cassette subfamily B protein
VRWRVPLLRDAPDLATDLALELRALPDVIDVTTNAATAGVLVVFDTQRSFDSVDEVVRERVHVLSVRFPRPPRTTINTEPTPGGESKTLRNLVIAGAGMAAASAISGTLGSIVLWGGAAVAVAGGVIRGLRELREESNGVVAADPMVVLMRRYRGAMVRPSIASFWLRVVDLLPPFFVGAAVDILSTGPSTWIAALGFSTVSGQILCLAGLAFLAGTASVLLEYAQARLWHGLSQRIRYDLRMEAYRHVQTLDLAYIDGKSSGELLNLFIDDIDIVGQFFDTGARKVLHAITSMLLPLVALFVLPPWFVLLILLPMPLTIASAYWSHRRMGRKYEDVREAADQLAQELATNLNGFVTIKSFTAEEGVAHQIQESSEALRRSLDSANKVVATFNPFTRSWIMLGFDLLLLFAALFASSTTLSVGLFSAVVYLSLRMWFPLTQLGDSFDEIMHGRASLARLRALLDRQSSIDDGHERIVSLGRGAELAFDSISFVYPGQTRTISRMSFRVGPGQTLAIVGPSGSGKTTIVKLLLRFYDPTSGFVSIDGHDIRALSLDSLRRSISLVTQDAYLFNGTIRENIAMGKEGATIFEIMAAARVAYAHDFIEAMPDGYDTLVGERGVRLSGGERQRVAIARAVLKDAPILVLDEATSAIDSGTEAALLEALTAATPDRTKLVIAHRLSTVRNAGEIVVMKDGVARERGDHESLLAKDGIYAAFWQLQAGEGITNGS